MSHSRIDMSNAIRQGWRRTSYISPHNQHKTVLDDAHTTVGWWTPAGILPRAFGFVQLGSSRYDE
ncbi:LOW QUALITY PROTEIN: hypothetical protein PHMEG_00022050 [Phytophthora megakarya]|uniref:Uncharacterized protein n=1 Tax=Phytophthora megakarya TaxID=4795 RepID=A0A225VKE3_9STRA|nr:LOW QUALITY PROTEIN: hypothetical protein PHMEG_00022050 [Phytophthora megakarya]